MKTLGVFAYDPTVLKCAVIEMNEAWSPGIEGAVADIRMTTENVQLLDFDGKVKARYKEIEKEEFEKIANVVMEIVRTLAGHGLFFQMLDYR